MCGIAGILNFNRQEIAIADIRQMTDAIAHRGPDGEGHWIDSEKWVGLGHRRLSIIDLSPAGSQPMHYLERYTIIFNGEIYNYVEIKEKLLSAGYKFSSKSDTEVLLALYDQKKEKCLDDLDGMFAFVIYDNLEKKVFIARDRFGEKPFYFLIHDGSIYFASEIKAFWALGLPQDPDMETLFYYLHYGRVHHPFNQDSTFFKHVKKLKAGHFTVIQKGQLSVRQEKYWSLPVRPLDERDLDLKETEAQFFELFKKSIVRRLRSDVPIGSSLSGGLDSSAVVCMIDHLNSSKNIQQSTFSARFPGFAKDEGKFMDIVTNATHAKGFYTYPDQKGFVDNFEKLIYHQDEPFGSASIYAQYEVMRLAKENGVTVLLDGQGADEMLGGYSFYLETIKKESLASQSTGIGFSKKKAIELAKETFPWAYKLYHTRQIRKNFLTKSHGYSKDFIEMVVSLPTPEEIHHDLHGHLCHDLLSGNLEDLLRYADRNSMAHSREVRLPFLDKDFVEFTMSLPSSYKIREGWSKWIQRVSFQTIVPPEITWRKDKIGYEPPQKQWMQDAAVQEKIMAGKRKLYMEGILSKTESERKCEGTDANQIDDSSWHQLMAANLFK